jgi:TP901 family phage tail tape measure protein
MAQSYESYGSRADALASNAEDKVQGFKRKAEDAASAVAAEGGKALRNAGQAADDALTATRRFVEEQPLVAIGAVAAFALAVGALWKLNNSRRSDDLFDRLSDYVEPRYRALRRRI